MSWLFRHFLRSVSAQRGGGWLMHGVGLLALGAWLAVGPAIGFSAESNSAVGSVETKEDPARTKPQPSEAEDRQAELASRVRRLVRQLDAAQAAQRAQAEDALLAMGPEILSLLPEPEAQDSAEVALALRRIREQLERRLAESVLQPSLVSLPAGPLSYWEVFQRIYQQTGNRLRLRSDVQELSKKLLFCGPVEKKPFWSILDQLLDEGGMTIYFYDPGEELMVLPRPEHELPRSQGACYVGPLRIGPQRLLAQRDYRTRLGNQLVLVLEVAWEPRTRPVVLRLPHQSIQAEDDRGRAVSPNRPDGQTIVPVKVGQKAAELELRLALPDRSASRLESVRGKLMATLPGAIQRFSFKTIRSVRNQSQRRAGASLSLVDVRKEGGLWQVEVLLRYDQPSEAFQSHYHWFYRNQAYFESQDGRKIMSSGLEPFRHTDSEIGLRYQFEGVDEVDKYTFIYEAPGLLLSEEFPWQLQKLPLP